MSDDLLRSVLTHVIELKADVKGISTRLETHEKKHVEHDETHKLLHKRISDSKPEHVPFLKQAAAYARDLSIIGGVLYALMKFIDKT